MSSVESNAINKTLKDKLWSDSGKTPDVVIRGLSALPVGIKGGVCPKCGSSKLTGALITETADESDPNILCLECGYWRG